MTQMQRKRTRGRPVRYLWDPLVLCVALVVGLGFGGFMYWALTAPLAQGITAPGTLVIKDRRRTIQHLEGGIISAISIREGQSVAEGEVLVELTDSTAQARLLQVEADWASYAAALDRYEAVLIGKDRLTFDRLSSLPLSNVDLATLKQAERQVFADTRAALRGERALIEAKLSRIEAERAALFSRRDGKERELETLIAELDVQEKALSQRVGNISKVNDVRRQVTVAEAALATFDQENRVLDSSKIEAEQELAQVDLAFRADAAQEITRLRNELSTLEAERAALIDRQTRRELRAPIDGVIIDLKFPSVGGVVPPGEALFDIVPKEEIWRVDVRFDPKDRDDLREGLLVNLRYGTLDPINPPEISGTLDRIAPDATFDTQTQTYFYTAEVSIAADALAGLNGFDLSPGIPVEVFLDSGVTRTPMSYFTEPFEVMLRNGLRG